jgi:hypothetical protein
MLLKIKGGIFVGGGAWRWRGGVKRPVCAHGGMIIPEYLTLSIVNWIVFERLYLPQKINGIFKSHRRASQPQDPGSNYEPGAPSVLF